jgi:hypothetical protein
MSKSDYLENKVLDHVLRNTALTSPTTVYAALYTVAPSDTGGGTEVTGNAYARTAITFGAPSAGVASNSAAVTFPTATPSGWGTIVAMGVFDAATVGNLLYWTTITNKAVNAEDTAEFAIGDIDITET